MARAREPAANCDADESVLRLEIIMNFSVRFHIFISFCFFFGARFLINHREI